MKLSKTQAVQLETYKAKIDRVLLSYTLGTGVIAFLILIFIPVRSIPHRSARRIENMSGTLGDQIGVVSVFLLVAAVVTMLLLYLLHAYRYRKLLRDLQAREKEVIKVRATKLVAKEGPGPQEIELFFQPSFAGKNSIEFIDYPNFPPVRKGELIELELSKHAHVPLQIRSVAEEKPFRSSVSKQEFDEAMETIRMMQNLGKQN